MLRVVADTNVYISAFHLGGPPLEVLIFAIRRRVVLCVSPAILQEVEGIFLRKLGWSPEQTRDALRAIREFTQSVIPQEQIDLLKEDEADNRILECAAEAGAQVIVTGDKHLPTLRTFRGIGILSPRAFLDAHSAGVFNAL